MLAQERRQPLGDVALIGVELAEQARAEIGNGLAVIDIAGRQFGLEQFAAMVDHQVQFEAVEPAGRTFAAHGIAFEDPMVTDAQIVANGQRGGIGDGNACAYWPLSDSNSAATAQRGSSVMQRE